MILTLPPLTSLNKYIAANNSNRFISNSIKQNETNLVAWQCRAQKAPKLAKLTSLEFIWKSKDKRQDKDNISFSKKFILDGMVKAGVIPNDTYSLLPDKIVDRYEIGEPGVIVVFK
jgi:Holliday junction resolvase RusA-like endonuclease